MKEEQNQQAHTKGKDPFPRQLQVWKDGLPHHLCFQCQYLGPRHLRQFFLHHYHPHHINSVLTRSLGIREERDTEETKFRWEVYWLPLEKQFLFRECVWSKINFNLTFIFKLEKGGIYSLEKEGDKLFINNRFVINQQRNIYLCLPFIYYSVRVTWMISWK